MTPSDGLERRFWRRVVLAAIIMALTLLPVVLVLKAVAWHECRVDRSWAYCFTLVLH